MSFELAWSASMRHLIMGRDAVTRREWKAVLTWARPEFELAYNHQPSPATETLAALGTRPELPGDQAPDGRVVEVAA